MNTPAEKLVAAVQARGSDADDPRDAAHEACHAIAWRVKKAWTRDNIHAKKPRDRGFGVADEITARAVEQLVCADLKIDYDPQKWAMVCYMEMLKNEGIALPSGDWLPNAIQARAKTPMARRMADQVLALATAPLKKRRSA